MAVKQVTGTRFKVLGFTLIEIIMTVGVLGVLFATAVALFLRTFRAGGKTGSIISIEQNAQLSINIIDRLIKNAQAVNSACPATTTSLILTNADGYQTTISLILDDEVSRIASNSTPISTPEVEVSNLSFTCAKEDGVPEQIDVSFDIEYGSTAEGVVTTRTFSTKSGLRTY